MNLPEGDHASIGEDDALPRFVNPPDPPGDADPCAAGLFFVRLKAGEGDLRLLMHAAHQAAELRVQADAVLLRQLGAAVGETGGFVDAVVKAAQRGEGRELGDGVSLMESDEGGKQVAIEEAAILDGRVPGEGVWLVQTALLRRRQQHVARGADEVIEDVLG